MILDSIPVELYIWNEYEWIDFKHGATLSHRQSVTRGQTVEKTWKIGGKAYSGREWGLAKTWIYEHVKKSKREKCIRMSHIFNLNSLDGTKIQKHISYIIVFKKQHAIWPIDYIKNQQSLNESLVSPLCLKVKTYPEYGGPMWRGIWCKRNGIVLRPVMT